MKRLRFLSARIQQRFQKTFSNGKKFEEAIKKVAKSFFRRSLECFMKFSTFENIERLLWQGMKRNSFILICNAKQPCHRTLARILPNFRSTAQNNKTGTAKVGAIFKAKSAKLSKLSKGPFGLFERPVCCEI